MRGAVAAINVPRLSLGGGQYVGYSGGRISCTSVPPGGRRGAVALLKKGCKTRAGMPDEKPEEESISVRRPGLEPGFRRWQRLVITTTLSAHACAFALCALQHGIFRLIRLSKRGPDRAVSSLHVRMDGRCFRAHGRPCGRPITPLSRTYRCPWSSARLMFRFARIQSPPGVRTRMKTAMA